MGTAILVGIAYLACAVVAFITLGLSTAWSLILAANFLLVSVCILLARVATNDDRLSSRTEALTLGISTIAPLGTQAVQYLLQPLVTGPVQVEGSSVIGAAIVDLRLGYPLHPALVYLLVLIVWLFVSGVVAVIGADRARRGVGEQSSHWFAILLLTGSMLLLQPWFGGVIHFDPSNGLVPNLIALGISVAAALAGGVAAALAGRLVRGLTLAARRADRVPATYFSVARDVIAVFIAWFAFRILLYKIRDSEFLFENIIRFIEQTANFTAALVVSLAIAFSLLDLLRKPPRKGGSRKGGSGGGPGPFTKLLDWLGQLTARLAAFTREVGVAALSLGSAILAKLSGLIATLTGATRTAFTRWPRRSMAISIGLAAVLSGLLAAPAIHNYSTRIFRQTHPAPKARPTLGQARQSTSKQPPARIEFAEISVSCLGPYWEYGRADRVSAPAQNCMAYSPADVLIAVGSATPRGDSTTETGRAQLRGQELAALMLQASRAEGRSPRIYILNRGIETRGADEPRSGPRVRALAGTIYPQGAAIDDETVVRDLGQFLRDPKNADHNTGYKLCNLTSYGQGQPQSEQLKRLDCGTGP